jgi:hypothetical protein
VQKKMSLSTPAGKKKRLWAGSSRNFSFTPLSVITTLMMVLAVQAGRHAKFELTSLGII